MSIYGYILINMNLLYIRIIFLFGILVIYKMTVLKYITHSKKAIGISKEFGWYPGARYTNLRDVKTFEFEKLGFLDID